MTTVIKDKILRSDIVHYDGITKTSSRKDSTGGTISGLKLGVEVDVLQVYGSGVDYTKSTIQKCINAIGSASVTLVFNPGTWTIDENLTIGSNFTCRVPAGAVFNVSSGKTLTFSGPVIHDSATWTSGSGTVTESGTRVFTGAESHSGTETHTGTESHSGTETHTGTVSFSGTTTILDFLTGICEFRLTLTTAVPVTTSDVTAATTLYCTPYKGNRIALHIFPGQWAIRSSAEFSIAVPATTSQMYDVFVYDNSGVPTLELTAWTNDTTRATALTTQNGVLVKSGDTTRRYMGSFRTTGVSGQTEDSLAKRYVWNYHNRVHRSLLRQESTDTWSYTTNTIRQANGSSSNQVEVVIGYSEEPVEVSVYGIAASDQAGNSVDMFVGVGLDSTSANSAQIVCPQNNSAASIRHAVSAHYKGFPGIGRHYFAWLEASTASGTTTWYGDRGGGTGASTTQTGMIGICLG